MEVSSVQSKVIKKGGSVNSGQNINVFAKIPQSESYSSNRSLTEGKQKSEPNPNNAIFNKNVMDFTPIKLNTTHSDELKQINNRKFFTENLEIQSEK